MEVPGGRIWHLDQSQGSILTWVALGEGRLGPVGVPAWSWYMGRAACLPQVEAFGTEHPHENLPW